jgi:hypothetical protein
MDDRIADLLKIFQEEIRLYRDLVEHARHKTALLVQGRVDAILESNRAEEKYSERLRVLDAERVRVCRDLGRSFRIPRDGFTLMRLADDLEPSLAREIRTQATLLRDVVSQLKSINASNMKLSEKAAGHFQGLLVLFFNAMSSYRQTGLFAPMPSIRPTFSQSA